MDGGVDKFYRDFFGLEIERKVQLAIGARPEGHLPVGAALLVATGHAEVPYLIVAPTMMAPEMVESLNCSRAMRAMLRIAAKYANLLPDIYCPGLGTGVGQVPFESAAEAMAKGYRDWKSVLMPITSPKYGLAG